jgi:hypothetical protein
MSVLVKNHIYKPIECFFCKGAHVCRDCPVEANMAPMFKKKVGYMMEYYVAENIKCPECENLSLEVIGNHTPSLDLICRSCNKKFEVKSKCLSVDKIPTDIMLPHGSYIDYKYRLKEGLNLIVIVYGIDRINKLINVREVLYANNNKLMKSHIVEVSKKEKTNLSTIFIKNKNLISRLNVDPDAMTISFQIETN